MKTPLPQALLQGDFPGAGEGAGQLLCAAGPVPGQQGKENLGSLCLWLAETKGADVVWEQEERFLLCFREEEPQAEGVVVHLLQQIPLQWVQ